MVSLHETLHRPWLTELLRSWHEFNKRHLGGALKPPVLQIDLSTARLGHWQRDTRTLGLAHEHLLSHRWEDVLDTLKHEMAHQYVDEVLGGDVRPHGPQFARACALLEIRSDATGNPRASDDPAARVLKRVQKLLALATSANRHEAEAAMAAANTLLLRYNLDLPQDGPPRDYEARRLGDSAAAIALEAKLVSSILSEFFFVECIWVTTYNARRLRHERVLEVLGTSENLEMAAYVHDFLHASTKRLWEQAKKDMDLPANRRREFSAGLLTGFRDKLRGERQRNEEQGLVWLGDADLDRFLRGRHPYIRSMGSSAVNRGRAHAAGRAAGEGLTLNKPVREHQSRGLSLPRGRDD
ncbi:SprT-like domain-containing protein [Nannocystis sp. RBIL2]|uniref:SprT-like domain-containing protein n=1 Tax=Nannocystis sp. RBIL2 TaxID=2996788 RepID=UPI00226EA623|nr:SprT-like domain-containing protein [Nannocystis sp. RBIL2]MCY1069984.1 SprT-like domain-containing protein [Nannocystis sp. RBIL2]